MKITFAAIALLLCAFCLSTVAQTRNHQKTAKPGPARASLRVKVGPTFEPRRPVEENAGVWNDYISEEHGFRITFPAPAGDVASQEIEEFINFETFTAQAQYNVLVRDMLAVLNNSQLEDLFESVVQETTDERAKLIGARHVYLNGSLGKELIFEEADRMVFGRFFVLESKLFMLTVSIPKRDYTREFDRWVYKYFESFGVRANSKFEA